MRRAQGFITDDDQFFESELAAAYHERSSKLQVAFQQFAGPQANFARWLGVVINLAPEIMEFYRVHQAKEKQNIGASSSERTRDAFYGRRNTREVLGQDQADDRRREEDDETYVEQSLGGTGRVSDVRPRSLGEEIPDDGAFDGAGMWGGDAQGVWGGEAVAIVEDAEFEEARPVRRGSPVRL